jgi:lipopolysaccharide biosynthesis regulator YciM
MSAMNLPIHYYIIFGAALLLIVVVAVLVYRRPGRQPRLHNPYIEALKLLVDGHREGAFARLQEAVRLGSAPTDAYIKLGNLLRERGEVSKALQIHQSLTVKTNLSKSEKVELYLSLAEDNARMGNSEKSVRVLETAIRKLNIKDPDVYSTLARHLHVLGEHDKAYDALRDVKKLGGIGDRELALYMSSSAEALVEKGDLKEARKILQRALRHDSQCPPGLLMLGNIAADTNDLDTAINHWKQVALISPQLAGTVLNKLETTLFERGRFSDIENIYDEVRAARAGDEAACLGLAAYYRKQGRGEEAIRLLEEYLTVHADSVPASLLLASFYARYRDADTVQRFLDESIKDPWRANHFECRSCSLRSDVMRWHCPRCNAFDSFSTNNHET